MSATEYILTAIRMTGLDIPRAHVAKLTRGYNTMRKEVGAAAARRWLATELRSLETRAVAAMCLSREI